MQRLPEPLRDLVDKLEALPGVGERSALRMALTLLKWPEARARNLGQAIWELRDRLFVCGRCNGLADADPCHICSDPNRQDDMLCVVSEWDSLLALEQGGFFKGMYMILGGLLAPLDGVDSGELELGRLRERLAEGKVTELVLALGSTLEAENTASYVKNMVSKEFPGLGVTRLAQGIPLGAEVKYMDAETLRQSLLYRQKL
ncbi:MAG: recombination protein RecR [Desulfovibrio sp.]|nr:MAG: recombination protein RecR [Desulfovibrio sp.]